MKTSHVKSIAFVVLLYICFQMTILIMQAGNTIRTNEKVLGETDSTLKSVLEKFVFNDMSVKNGTTYKEYRNFTLTPPLFIDDDSRILFYKNVKNIDFLRGREKDTLLGEIIVANNSTVDVSQDCGYKSSREWIIPWTQVPTTNVFKTLVPLLVPEAQTFQHFLDGALPKIIQALPFLQDPSTKILMYPFRDKINNEILERLNISSSQIVNFNKDSDGPVYGAHRLIYPCITPPIHPDLWREGRRAMGAPSKLQVPINQSYVVFVTRGGCRNCGRLVLNKDNVLKMLLERYGKDRLRVFDGPMSLQESIDLFGKANVIMGSHGGGMYNVNFAPAQTAIIEFMPTHPNGDMGAASYGIIWAMSQMLGQRYWRLCINPERNNNMNVDITLLTRILDIIDKDTG